jgi:hypothetical protein
VEKGEAKTRRGIILSRGPDGGGRLGFMADVDAWFEGAGYRSQEGGGSVIAVN